MKTPTTMTQAAALSICLGLAGSVFPIIGLNDAYALSGGLPANGNNVNNSVVRVTNLYYGGLGCTGVLIAPDIVLTSGHCVIGQKSPDGLRNPTSLFDGGWNRLPDQGTMLVTIGPTAGTIANNLALAQVENRVVLTATIFSEPPLTSNLGHDDIAMIKLPQAIPQRLASPRQLNVNFTDPLTTNPTIFSFGPNCANPGQPVVRQRALLDQSSYNSTGPSYFRMSYASTSVLGCQGDSGSPIFESGSNNVIGTLQQASNSIGVVKTFSRGGFEAPYADKPDIAAWLRGAFWCKHDGAKMYTGDFDGDGKKDLLCHTSSSGIMDIDYARDGFNGNNWQSRNAWCKHAGAKLYIADVNGDRRDDRICHTQSSGWTDVSYAQSHSNGFTGQQQFTKPWCNHAGAKFHMGDMDGDGRVDRICHTASNGIVDIDYARDGFNGNNWQSSNGWCHHQGANLHVGDINQDGRADLTCVTLPNRAMRFSHTNGRGQPSMRDDHSKDWEQVPPLDPSRL